MFAPSGELTGTIPLGVSMGKLRGSAAQQVAVVEGQAADGEADGGRDRQPPERGWIGRLHRDLSHQLDGGEVPRPRG